MSHGSWSPGKETLCHVNLMSWEKDCGHMGPVSVDTWICVFTGRRHSHPPRHTLMVTPTVC